MFIDKGILLSKASDRSVEELLLVLRINSLSDILWLAVSSMHLLWRLLFCMSAMPYGSHFVIISSTLAEFERSLKGSKWLVTHWLPKQNSKKASTNCRSSSSTQLFSIYLIYRQRKSSRRGRGTGRNFQGAWNNRKHKSHCPLEFKWTKHALSQYMY